MSRFAWPAACVAGILASTVPVLAQRVPISPPTGLAPEVLALACAPSAAFGDPATPLRVTGGQDVATHGIYAPGDLVTINAGTANGIKVGQEFFVRRVQTPRVRKPNGKDQVTIQTAGWIKVWAVDDAMSLATVTHACDTVDVGDYLEPFTLPEPVTAASNKPKAERDHYARVMQGADLKSAFGRGDFFVINRGSAEGVKPGAQFVVYRDKKEAKNFLFELGEAVAVNVGEKVSTLRVTLSRDAFLEGDYVAERK
jgi:hypothetical protein